MIRGDGGRTLRAILEQICNKWTLLIVATLEQGTLRFTELLPPALALAGWAIEHVPHIEASRAVYQARKLGT